MSESQERMARAAMAQPRVLGVDPGVQVEQEPVESFRPWRVIMTDTEGPTGIAPVCETDHTPHSEDGESQLKDWVFDCCPGPHIELWSEGAAVELAARFTALEAMAAGS